MWGGYMGYGPWGGGGALMAVFMGLFWLVLLVAIGALVFAMLRRNSAHSVHTEAGTALRILEERYARGEINKEEFDQKRRDLQR